jgi:hypothetical protein
VITIFLSLLVVGVLMALSLVIYQLMVRSKARCPSRFSSMIMLSNRM